MKHSIRITTFGTHWCDTCNSPYCDDSPEEDEAMGDLDKIRQHIATGRDASGEISDACARVIASQFSEGMGRTQSFASTGAIVEYPDDPIDGMGRKLSGSTLLWRELFSDWEALEEEWKLAANYLGTYLGKRHSEKCLGPVEGWNGLWL